MKNMRTVWRAIGVGAIIAVIGLAAIGCDNGAGANIGGGNGGGAGIGGGNGSGAGGGGADGNSGGPPAGAITNPALNGTWLRMGENHERWIFNNGNFTFYLREQGNVGPWVGIQKGTFTTAGNVALFHITHVHRSTWELATGTEWLDRYASLPHWIASFIEWQGRHPDQQEIAEFMTDFDRPLPFTYILDGGFLTLRDVYYEDHVILLVRQ